MDTVIHAATVIAAFAALHERVMELIKQFVESRSGVLRLKLPELRTEANIDRWNIAFAFMLACATHANLLELFVVAKGADSSLFFRHYMAWPTALADWRHEQAEVVLGVWGRLFQEVGGFALMALSTALGSKFWHDLVKSLVAFQEKAGEVATAAAPTPVAKPVLPPAVPETQEGIAYPRSLRQPIPPLEPLSTVDGVVKVPS